MLYNSPSFSITKYIFQALCTVTLSFFSLLYWFSNLNIRASLTTPLFLGGLGWSKTFFNRWLVQLERSITVQLNCLLRPHRIHQISPTHTTCTNKSNLTKTKELSYIMFKFDTKEHKWRSWKFFCPNSAGLKSAQAWTNFQTSRIVAKLEQLR